ncbi:MAG: ATP-binding cassette domain-containing protein [Myxococcales bacterium]|nr:ATP-binding cassette domain-containing protein [Myxococcales bacterium]MCB9750237.1 ATP-binding cassette domain-containing protein [Myxococcales bacterium]
MAMIAFEEVTKTHGIPGSRRPTLDSINLEIEPGEFVLLTGPSGSGKTTLLNLVTALERPDSGSVLIGGRDVHRLTSGSLPFLRRNIGVIHQELYLVPEVSVRENVRWAVEVQGVRHRTVRARTQVSLELLQLADHADSPVGSLSRDVQQRVAIARALAAEPAIVLADEPTSALDGHYAHLVLDLLARLASRGTTIVLASRSPLVSGYVRAGRVLQLQDGTLRPTTRTVIREFDLTGGAGLEARASESA